MLAELLDLLNKRSDAWDTLDRAESAINALLDRNASPGEWNRAEATRDEANRMFEHFSNRVCEYLDDGDVLDALRKHLQSTLSTQLETKPVQPCVHGISAAARCKDCEKFGGYVPTLKTSACTCRSVLTRQARPSCPEHGVEAAERTSADTTNAPSGANRDVSTGIEP